MICAVVQDGVVVNMIVAEGSDPAPDGCDLAEVVQEVDGKEVRSACNIGWQIADVALPEPVAEVAAALDLVGPVAGPASPTDAGATDLKP